MGTAAILAGRIVVFSEVDYQSYRKRLNQIFILHPFKNTQRKNNQRFVLVLLPNHARVNLRLWWNIILNRSSRFISGAPYTGIFFCKKEIPSRLPLRKAQKKQNKI